MTNKLHYKKNGPPVDDIRWHIREVKKAARRLFVDGDGTVEQAFSAILDAAYEEFHFRIVVRSPVRLIIDGIELTWPTEPAGESPGAARANGVLGHGRRI